MPHKLLKKVVLSIFQKNEALHCTNLHELLLQWIADLTQYHCRFKRRMHERHCKVGIFIRNH